MKAFKNNKHICISQRNLSKDFSHGKSRKTFLRKFFFSFIFWWWVFVTRICNAFFSHQNLIYYISTVKTTSKTSRCYYSTYQITLQGFSMNRDNSFVVAMMSIRKWRHDNNNQSCPDSLRNPAELFGTNCSKKCRCLTTKLSILTNRWRLVSFST